MTGFSYHGAARLYQELSAGYRNVMLITFPTRQLCAEIDPSFSVLRYEFVTKNDFRDWLVHTGRAMPAFWYADEERGAVDDSKWRRPPSAKG